MYLFLMSAKKDINVTFSDDIEFMKFNVHVSVEYLA